MKLLAAGSVFALTRAQEQYGSEQIASPLANEYCLNETTDYYACIDVLEDAANEEAVNFCDEKEDKAEQSDCYSSILEDAEEDSFADSEFAMDEFLGVISEDPMLQNVLAELNGLQSYLTAQGVTRRINEDGEESVPDNQQLQAAMDSEAGLKRFVELKQLVSWMQPKDKRISRYCFYGCWCLPEGAHSFVAGEGRPVDLVDKACQYLWFCYTCAKQEFTQTAKGKIRECVPDKQKYTFRFRYNKQKPADYSQRDIICKDNFYSPLDTPLKIKSSCAKAICECDRGLAMRLYRSWRHWDRSRHRIWSQRVTSCNQLSACQLMPSSTPAETAAKAACIKRGCLFVVARRCLTCDGPSCGGSSNNHQMECCGVYENDGGRMEMRDHGGTHECCSLDARQGAGKVYPWDGHWFNTITHECINGYVVTPGSIVNNPAGNKPFDCEAGYYQDNKDKCRPFICDCDNGIGAETTACPANGVKKCVGCDPGYNLQGDTCVEA